MENLKLNDGTVLPDCSAMASNTDLFVYLQGIAFKTAFQQFVESRKTKKITYTRNGGEKVVFDGFSRLVALRDEDDGMVTAVLRKEGR